MKTFQQQFSELKAFLGRNGLEFLIVGGVAVQHYGYSRATMDHLIAMKFHAYRQGGARRIKDFNDIVWLSVLNDLDPERDLRDVALQYANEGIYGEVVKAIEATGGGK